MVAINKGSEKKCITILVNKQESKESNGREMFFRDKYGVVYEERQKKKNPRELLFKRKYNDHLCSFHTSFHFTFVWTNNSEKIFILARTYLFLARCWKPAQLLVEISMPCQLWKLELSLRTR